MNGRLDGITPQGTASKFVGQVNLNKSKIAEEI